MDNSEKFLAKAQHHNFFNLLLTFTDGKFLSQK